MIRIRPINRNTADSGAAELLEAVERKMRAVPNIISTMAH